MILPASCSKRSRDLNLMGVPSSSALLPICRSWDLCVPELYHILVKLSYMRQLYFFLLQQFSNTSFFFDDHQYFSHLPSKKREIQLSQHHGDHPTTTFQLYFLLYSCWLPNTILLGVVLGNR
jgi:hypothetical protein